MQIQLQIFMNLGIFDTPKKVYYENFHSKTKDCLSPDWSLAVELKVGKGNFVKKYNKWISSNECEAFMSKNISMFIDNYIFIEEL